MCVPFLQVKHPLLAELMACFAALLKEYKGEVEDILVADKQVRGVAVGCATCWCFKQLTKYTNARRPTCTTGVIHCNMLAS